MFLKKRSNVVLLLRAVFDEKYAVISQQFPAVGGENTDCVESVDAGSQR